MSQKTNISPEQKTLCGLGKHRNKKQLEETLEFCRRQREGNAVVIGRSMKAQSQRAREIN